MLLEVLLSWLAVSWGKLAGANLKMYLYFGISVSLISGYDFDAILTGGISWVYIKFLGLKICK